MVYLASLWLMGRTLRKPPSSQGIDPPSIDAAELFAEASLLLGPEEAERLVSTLSAGQLRAVIDKKKLNL